MAGTEVQLANQIRCNGLKAGHLGRKRQSELSARSVTSSVRVHRPNEKSRTLLTAKYSL